MFGCFACMLAQPARPSYKLSVILSTEQWVFAVVCYSTKRVAQTTAVVLEAEHSGTVMPDTDSDRPASCC